MTDRDDAVFKDFFTYGLHRDVPLAAGNFLAHICYRRGGPAGAQFANPADLARILEIKSDPFTAIIAFLRDYNFVTAEADDSLTLTQRGEAWWRHYQQPVTSEMLHPMLLTAGLGRVANVIEQQARPSIRLTAHLLANEDALPLGASKFGGSPDLPFAYEWPRNGIFPLAFIAQINLRDVTAYDPGQLLPRSGMLSFFVDSARLYSASLRKDFWRMHYLDDENMSALRRTPMPAPLPERSDDGPFRPCAISFAPAVTLANYLPYYNASWHSDIRARLGPITEPFTDVERKRYAAVQQRLAGPAYTINRMLGHPDPIQGFDLSPEDVLLLQIDSEEDAGMMWGDVGRLYWWMPRDDLRRCDFTRIKFEEQCS